MARLASNVSTAAALAKTHFLAFDTDADGLLREAELQTSVLTRSTRTGGVPISNRSLPLTPTPTNLLYLYTTLSPQTSFPQSGS